VSLRESINIDIGVKMPQFELRDYSGKLYSSKDLFGEKGLLVVFTCNHCPYAKAIWPRLINLSFEIRGWGVNTVAVNPNINENYPEDSKENMAIMIKDLKIDFPYLVDESQLIAKSFKAQCTPDIYLMDSDNNLFYHGRFDDNWKEPDQVEREELKEAIWSMKRGVKFNSKQNPSIGCSIKWRE
jgi:peroxiredoxin